MAPRPIGEPALLAIAARLGADVPFLASASTYALAWGRGERLLDLPAPDEREVLLVLPPFARQHGGGVRLDRFGARMPVTSRSDAIGVLDATALGELDGDRAASRRTTSRPSSRRAIR